MRSNEVIPASTIQTGLKIKLSAPRAANKRWQQRGPLAWGELIQQTEQLRSSVTCSNAGSEIVQHITRPIRLSRNNISETGRTCTRRKNNLQSIKHKTQIMKEKYFCILAYISMRLITMVLSHRQKMWPGRAIHRRIDQRGLTKGKSCSKALEVLQTIDLFKMVVCWFI